MVRVDKHAARPETQHPAAGPGAQQHRSSGGDCGVIADPHDALLPLRAGQDVAAARYPCCRYHLMAWAVPVGRSVAAAKPSSRRALLTSYMRLWVRKSSRLVVSGAA